jgi:hypothetical protein
MDDPVMRSLLLRLLLSGLVALLPHRLLEGAERTGPFDRAQVANAPRPGGKHWLQELFSGTGPERSPFGGGR